MIVKADAKRFASAFYFIYFDDRPCQSITVILAAITFMSLPVVSIFII
jgi:hypothetical protein